MQPFPISIDPSEFPSQARLNLLTALRQGQLPGKMLYQSPAQAARWLAYHQAYSPSRKEDGVRQRYGAAFAQAVQEICGAPLLYVGLGCGGGQKDRQFLEVAVKVSPDLLSSGLSSADFSSANPSYPIRRTPLRYVPLDASAPLVMESALHVCEAIPNLPIHPLVADLSATPPLREWLHTLPCEPDTRTVFTSFGMLPNMDPARFPKYLAALLTPGDRLLVSANLSPNNHDADAQAILPEYDNPLALAWYQGALRELGLDPLTAPIHVRTEVIGGAGGADGVGNGVVGDGSAWRIVAEATLTRDVTLALFDESIPLRAGQALEVFHSNRFTLAAAKRLMAGAGLVVRQTWVDDGGVEGILLCEAL